MSTITARSVKRWQVKHFQRDATISPRSDQRKDSSLGHPTKGHGHKRGKRSNA